MLHTNFHQTTETNRGNGDAIAHRIDNVFSPFEHLILLEFQIGDHRFDQGPAQQVLVLRLEVLLVIGIEHDLRTHIHDTGRLLVDLENRLGLIDGHRAVEVKHTQDHH